MSFLGGYPGPIMKNTSLQILLTRFLPSWIIVALLLVGLREGTGASFWLPLGVWLAWVAKDVVFLPSIQSLEASEPMTGHEGLIGKTAVTRGLLDPSGYVFLRGELWQAEVIPEDRPIAAGSPVRIQDVRGLTLIVAREPGG
jgi:membrane protein implicated in regulation of membrane protease activity